jgi:hypothetical protein
MSLHPLLSYCAVSQLYQIFRFAWELQFFVRLFYFPVLDLSPLHNMLRTPKIRDPTFVSQHRCEDTPSLGGTGKIANPKENSRSDGFSMSKFYCFDKASSSRPSHTLNSSGKGLREATRSFYLGHCKDSFMPHKVHILDSVSHFRGSR